MDQRELRKKINDMAIEKGGWGTCHHLKEIEDDLLQLINQHVKEVIGEDLEATNYMYFYKDKYKNLPEDFKETIIKACIQYDNDLKEEQRKRAGL